MTDEKKLRAEKKQAIDEKNRAEKKLKEAEKRNSDLLIEIEKLKKGNENQRNSLQDAKKQSSKKILGEIIYYIVLNVILVGCIFIATNGPEVFSLISSIIITFVLFSFKYFWSERNRLWEWVKTAMDILATCFQLVAVCVAMFFLNSKADWIEFIQANFPVFFSITFIVVFSAVIVLFVAVVSGIIGKIIDWIIAKRKKKKIVSGKAA